MKGSHLFNQSLNLNQIPNKTATLGFDLYSKESAKMNKLNGLNYGKTNRNGGDLAGLSQSVDIASLNTLNLLQ